eukprot:g1210.t1
MIKAGLITVDRGAAGDAPVDQATRVREGDIVRVRAASRVAPMLHRDADSLQRHVSAMQKGGFRAVFDGAMHAVVFKPAGFHTCGRHWKTMATGLPSILQPSDEPDAVPPAAVHRLDARVCGLVLVAKTRRAAAAFGRLLAAPPRLASAVETGALSLADTDLAAPAAPAAPVAPPVAPAALVAPMIRKRYRAILGGRLDVALLDCICDGALPAPRGCVVTRAARVWPGAAGGGAYLLQRALCGKPAATELRVLGHTPCSARCWGLGHRALTTVELVPLTGRRHQLRLHTALLGFSIMGDDLYPGAGPAERGASTADGEGGGEGGSESEDENEDEDEDEDEGRAGAVPQHSALANAAVQRVLRGRGLFLQACGLSYTWTGAPI